MPVCEKQDFVLAKQLLRSDTSIGANIEGALGGHAKEAKGDHWLYLF